MKSNYQAVAEKILFVFVLLVIILIFFLNIRPEITNNTHLPEYSNFQHYNDTERFKGLRISETQVDNKLYYLLADNSGELCVLINETDATIKNGSKEISIEISPLFSSTDVSLFHLEDVTEDGTPELLYFFVSGGTGTNITKCRIFDTKRLEELQIEPFISKMLSGIQITPISLDGRTLTCQILNKTNEDVLLGTVDVDSSTSMNDCSYTPTDKSDHVYLYAANGVLNASVSFSVKNAKNGSCVGNVLASFSFDPNTNSLKLAVPYAIELHKQISSF